jgi:hypothetical protein
MGSIRVEVAYGRPERQELIAVTVSDEATAVDAIRASGIEARFPEIDLSQQSIGVFARVLKDPEHHVLSEGDRVEIYRPLVIDPKDARASRAGTRR